MIGLIKTIDRFDLTRRVGFSSFVIPYIEGEIKRFFRNSAWAAHVPRRSQGLRTELARVKERLSVELDRDPTVRSSALRLARGARQRHRSDGCAGGYQGIRPLASKKPPVGPSGPI